MLGGDVSVFTDAEEFQACLPRAQELLVLRPGRFCARLTRVRLPELHLLQAREAQPRVAYICLPEDRVFVAFPTKPGSPLICGGSQLEFGEILLHSVGEHFHQRTTAACHWGAISLQAGPLAAYADILAGKLLAPPPAGLVLRPPRAAGAKLLQLHRQAAHLAYTNLDGIAHPEVARGLEQELIWALTTSLVSGAPRHVPALCRRRAAHLVQLEAAIAALSDRPSVADVCRLLGVSERTLQGACRQVLGMSVGRYLRLRWNGQSGNDL